MQSPQKTQTVPLAPPASRKPQNVPSTPKGAVVMPRTVKPRG